MGHEHTNKTTAHYTNKYDLPVPLVRALAREDRGWTPGRIGVTKLIGPPLIRQLMHRHAGEIVDDVSEWIWALLGSAVHYVCEKGAPANAFAEEKLEQVFQTSAGPYTVVGVADHFEDGTLYDYKVTSAWTYVYENGKPKPEWVAQANVYRGMWEHIGFPVNKAQILCIYRDWTKSNALRDPKQYPQVQAGALRVPLMPLDELDAYIHERLELHVAADAMEAGNCIDQIPECTPGERWSKPTTWAVMKGTNKRATKVCDSLAQAQERIAADAKPDQFSIVERPGANTRCDDYCPVSEFCPYRMAERLDDEANPAVVDVGQTKAQITGDE